MDIELHRGRLIDHLHLRARNLDATKRFYRAALSALGRGDAIKEDETHFEADELWIDAADAPPSTGGRVSHVHLAFRAKDRAQVDAFHRAVLAAGGRDNGGPGERANYHPGYYGAFAIDPDGNNIEAVYHGPFEASAESVVVKATIPGG